MTRETRQVLAPYLRANLARSHPVPLPRVLLSQVLLLLVGESPSTYPGGREENTQRSG